MSAKAEKAKINPSQAMLANPKAGRYGMLFIAPTFPRLNKKKKMKISHHRSANFIGLEFFIAAIML